MKVSLLIVTYEKDFPWLDWCLKSVAKFAKGFDEVVVAIPADTDWIKVLDFATGYNGHPFLRFHHFDDWPGKGFLRHMDRVMHADQICPQADFIAHLDADCIFTERVTPEDYFVDGKPVLIGAPYPWIVHKFKNPTHLKWKQAVERGIGGVSQREFMRRHPAVHYRAIYGTARDLLQRHTGRPCSDYIRSTNNEFPHQFAEFPTLGEVAWRHFHDRYHWVSQEKDPWPKDKLMQFWSRAPMDQPQTVWYGGDKSQEMVPLNVMRKVVA